MEVTLLLTTLCWNRVLRELYGHIPAKVPAMNGYLPMPRFSPLLCSTSGASECPGRPTG